MPQNNQAMISQVNPNEQESGDTNNASTTRASTGQLRLSTTPLEEYILFNGIQSEARQEDNSNESETLRLMRISRHLRHRRARLIAFLIGPSEAIANIAAYINRRGEIVYSYVYNYPEIPEFRVENAEEVAHRVVLRESDPEKSSSNTSSSDLEKDLLLEKLIKARIQDECATNDAGSEIDVYDYQCPLTRCIFDKPVIASDGKRYELSAIKEHFKTNATFDTRNSEWVVYSPMNRSKLRWEVRFDTEMHNWINETIITENQRSQEHGHRLFTHPRSHKRQRLGEDDHGNTVTRPEKKRSVKP